MCAPSRIEQASPPRWGRFHLLRESHAASYALEKPNRLSRLLPARIRIVSMRIDCAIDRCVVRLRRSNVIAPACLKMTVGGGEREREGGGRGRGGKIEKVRIIGWCESKKRRVIESNADEQRASSVMIA